MPGRDTRTAEGRAARVGQVRPIGAGRRRAAAIAAAIAFLVAVAMLFALPPLSRPLVGRLAAAWLRAHGADARIDIIALSDTALAARVRLGDPRDPDLTIDRLEMTYALSGPWSGRGPDLAPSVVRLIRPRMKARWRNGALQLGQLAGLVDWALRQPPNSRPLPDIDIVDGRLRLVTPGGVLAVTGDGAYADRRSLVFTGALAPFSQILPGATVSGDGGLLKVAGRGPRLMARTELGSVRLQRRSDSARAAGVSLQADLPWPPRRMALAGPAGFRLAVRGLVGGWGAARLADGVVTLAATGDVAATPALQRFAGDLTADLAAKSADGGGVRALGLGARASLHRLEFVHHSQSLALRSRGTLSLAADRVAGMGATVGRPMAAASLDEGILALDGNSWTGRATLVGRAAARGAVSPPLVRRLIGGSPPVSGAETLAGPVVSALRDIRLAAPRWRLDIDGRRARLALEAPARLDAASGAALTVTGQGVAAAAGDWRAAGAASLSGGGLPSLSLQAVALAGAPGRLAASMRGRGQLDTKAARGAEAEVRASLAEEDGRLRVDLLACAPIRAERLGDDDQNLQSVSLRLCPSGGPLLETSGGRWRMTGQLQAVRGDARPVGLGLRDADVAFAAAGGKAGLASAHVALGSSTLVDLTDPVRVRPLGLEGDVQGAGGAWRGAVSVSDRAKRPLAVLALRAAPGSPIRLDIDTGALAFAPGGLQPVDVTPLAAALRDVKGQASFAGWFEWGKRGEQRSGGELAVQARALTGPLGPLTNLDTRIVFTRLWPPSTAPSQRLTVAQITTLTPVTNLELVFDLQDDALNLRRARADVAGGRMSLGPMTAALRAGSRFEGALTLQGIDLGQVLAATSLSDQIKLQAIVDGRVPFSVGPSGVTLREGRLSSVGGGRLSISRAALGAPPTGAPSAAQGGVAQDFAYQALENLAFDSLEARLNSLPKDRLGVLFQIKGRHDPPKPQRATIRLADAVLGRAMERPLALPSDTKIDLTLDTSLNFGELVRALSEAWQDAIRPAAVHPQGAVPEPGTPVMVTPAAGAPAEGNSQPP